MEMNKYLRFFSIVTTFLIVISCSFGKKNKNIYNSCDSTYVNENINLNVCEIDSIDIYGDRIHAFGKDSLYAYNKKNILRYISYLSDSSVLKQIIFYDDGSINFIEYNYLFSKDSLFSEDYYPGSNKLNYAVWIKDTIIITGGNPIRCSRYFTMYHENGVKKEFGHFGYFNGQGNPIGKVTHMDSLGNIVMTMNYIYPKQSQEEIDEQGIFTFITEIKFHQNGNIMSEKKYSNYVYYEIDEEYKQPLGTWKYYNENGELTKTKEYGEYDRDYYQLSEELEN